ncbi:DoxX family protein [Zemynaea arenosa]|nr:DoxX family protein [Massilia arenosa]
MTLQNLGLLCLALMFVRAGVVHFMHFGAVAGMLRARRWPAPALLLAAGSLVQIVAGIGLLFAPTRAVSAGLLIGFTAAASITLLDFWHLTGRERTQPENAFFSNIAVCGGLLLAAAI